MLPSEHVTPDVVHGIAHGRRDGGSDPVFLDQIKDLQVPLLLSYNNDLLGQPLNGWGRPLAFQGSRFSTRWPVGSRFSSHLHQFFSAVTPLASVGLLLFYISVSDGRIEHCAFQTVMSMCTSRDEFGPMGIK